MPFQPKGESVRKVLEIRQKNPNSTIKQIVNELDIAISYQRVRQILMDAGLPHNKILKERKYCVDCGKPLGLSRHKTKELDKGICIRCQVKRNMVRVGCEVCGKEKFLRQSEIAKRKRDSRYKGHFFCTKKCQGVYVGKHHGIGVQSNLSE
jgi:formate dehydrogenase maturation protein FdhE